MTIEVESTQVAEIFEKDINKLCEDINVVIEAHNKLVDENAELKNIIKEVREYCLEKAKGRLERTLYDDILEILDKEVK